MDKKYSLVLYGFICSAQAKGNWVDKTSGGKCMAQSFSNFCAQLLVELSNTVMVRGNTS